MGIAGMAFSALAAWRRHSLSLTVVVVMWAAMWLPWARVDRAAFQYHVYASLPFMLLALAYFLAELWHGPGPRTWFLARAAAALAIVGAPLLWLLRTPLCIIAGTAVANPSGLACASEATRTAQLSQGGVVAIVLLTVGTGLAVYLAWRGARRRERRPGSDRHGRAVLLPPVLMALLTLVLVNGALLLLDTSSTTAVVLSSDVLALLALAVLAVPAWLTLRSRDPRRLVLGVLAAALLWLLLWYPNISGLPLPADLAGIYQGLLPTWNYDFQFAVNTDLASEGGLVDVTTVQLGALTLLFVAAVAAVARSWGGAHAPRAVPPARPPHG